MPTLSKREATCSSLLFEDLFAGVKVSLFLVILNIDQIQYPIVTIALVVDVNKC
jgi:hypothetical protein